MADDHEDKEQPPPRYEGGIPILPGEPERAESARRAEKEDERKYKKHHTSIQAGILLTQGLLVIFGIIGTGISFYEARTARISAEQSKRAADLASDAFVINSDNFDRTMGQIVAQTAQQVKAADAARSAAYTAEKQLEVMDRPWVSVAFSPNSTIRFNNDTMDINLQVKYSNVGRGVATKVAIRYLGFLSNNPLQEMIARQNAVCNDNRTLNNSLKYGPAKTLFPGGEDNSEWIDPIIYMAEIKANLTDPHIPTLAGPQGKRISKHLQESG